ncbi:M56 family metallopeptidase [Fusibacter sp. 3D3]|uniref:M56 family metallopeptidase n=1 Tax=Fusibacter sp. 3D3 TaxID=1048380 RepID=UPI000853532C|nr:M56 family metallopeptidase [Fusibacter sp. 3D3]GAU76616.1 regulatory sensor-transducer, BlaR1/MecR1 family [Fusibacter sp. 3D3]
MFEKLFIGILNMSISASYVILIVIFLRWIMRKLPKIYAYVLWSVVWVRLINPFKLESVFSLVRVHHQTIPEDIGYAKIPAINSGILMLNQSINESLPPAVPYASVNPMQIHLFIGRTIWLFGLLLLCFYMMFTVVKIYMKLKTAIHLFDNVYETDAFNSPFVFGNRIYLTASLDLSERDYILTHERIHIKRRDHIIKPIVFWIVCVHWFNPLVWIAYTLMERDMELSCDESVINHAGYEIKTSYSKSLLSFAGKNRILGSCPFTFGEKATVKRIKNILSYKKPALWVMVIALVAIVILGISLITTPSEPEPDLSFLNPENLITSVYDQEMIKIDEVELEGYTRVGDGEAERRHSDVEVIDATVDILFEKLMASPQSSSNPNDYIEANPDVFKAILAYEDQALIYCFQSFESGDQLGLKGHLMAAVAANLCENEFSFEFSNGQAWYEHFITYAITKRSELGEADFEKHMPKAYLLLSIHEGARGAIQTIKIPDFEYLGEDPNLKLVYETEIQNQSQHKNIEQFHIPAVKVHRVSKEEDQIKIFATVYNAFYVLNGKEVKNDGGSIVPIALTYQLSSEGSYTLLEYEAAMDGGEFENSIKAFSVTPISGKPIEGLSKEIMSHYSDYSDLNTLQISNLKAHLLKYDLHEIVLITDYDDTRTPLTD